MPHGDNCTLFPDNPSQCDVIVVVKRTVASLSMVGSFFIIFIIWLFKKYKYFEQRLLLAMSIAAFMSNISYQMGDLHPEKGPICVLQAWWLSYFDRCALLLICCITFNLYWNAIKERKSKQFEKWYYIISWGLSLVISLLPLIDDHYGPAGPWCWIPRESSNSTVWRFMMWYIPLFVIITILFVVYGYTFYIVRKKEKEWRGMFDVEDQRLRESFTRKVKPLMAYPCIYLATSIFPLVHRIYNATTETPNFTLLLLHVIFNPLSGALNAIAYGIDKETLNKLNWPHIKVAFMHHFRPTGAVIADYQTDPTVTLENHIGQDNHALRDEPDHSIEHTKSEKNASLQHSQDVLNVHEEVRDDVKNGTQNADISDIEND